MCFCLQCKWVAQALEVSGLYVKEKKRKWCEKGAVEEYTCLSARGHFLIKHCTPSPSTGHPNSNSAVHAHSVSLSPFYCTSLSRTPFHSRHSVI